MNDFSFSDMGDINPRVWDAIIQFLNDKREEYLRTKDVRVWRTIIETLPMSYNYRRTICLNYQALANIYRQRKNHKLDEWRRFCNWIKTLPHSELITLEES